MKSVRQIFAVALVGVATTAPVGAYAGAGDSVNVFGALEVLSKSTNTIVCVPWTELGEFAPQSIRACDLVMTNNLTVGDTVLVYNLDTRVANQPYVGWVLGQKGWESITTVTQDGLATAPTAETARINRGKSFWLHRQRPMDGQNAVPFYLCGQYSVDPAESVAIQAGTVDEPVYHLLAAPTAEDHKLDDLGWKSYNVSTNDTILVPANSTDGTARIYFFEPTGGDYGKWYYWGKKNPSDPRSRTVRKYDDVLKAGTGFWYISRGGRMTVRW